MLPVSGVIDTRNLTITDLEKLSQKLSTISTQFHSNAELIASLNKKGPPSVGSTPTDDTLVEVVQFVIEAEKINSIPDALQKSQEIKEKARTARNEAAQLNVTVEALKRTLQEMEKLYESRQATLQLTRATSQKFNSD
ncbi:MAG: hypothetical protein ACRDFB_04760 [Rhabdochlamydiaceae bacterium]